MKYLVGNRGSGVTTNLILEASLSGASIVTATHAMKRFYEERAKQLNVYPPKVYTIDELNQHCRKGKIVIDNFDIVLKQILQNQYGIDVEVEAIGSTF